MLNKQAAEGYWADFPSTYRAEQIATIAQWIAPGDSGVVVGSSGTGKSNIAGFVASRQDVMAEHLPTQQGDCCFLHLDVNSLPTVSTPAFYRGLLYALQNTAIQAVPELASALAEVTAQSTHPEDALGLYFALQRAHQLLINRAGKKVVWLIDRFDEACKRLEPGTLSSLRSLRDQAKGRLAYIVFTRFPLARLRHPAEFDEFHEIMVGHTCWVGPMVGRDAQWIARQMAERYQTIFAETDVATLIDITGGLPAFLKAACSALASGQLWAGASAQSWTERLVEQSVFQRNCQELWTDCTAAEQTVLSSVAHWGDQKGLDRDIVAYLKKLGLLNQPAPDAKICLFSPIFASFVKQQQPKLSGGGITLDTRTGAVLRNGVLIEAEFTPLEARLLAYFLEHPSELCEKNAIIAYVWPDEKVEQGIRDDSLAQLVKRLRDKIEEGEAKHIYVQTVRGRGYRFVRPSL